MLNCTKMIKQLIRELIQNKSFAFLNLFSVAITIAVVMIFAMKLENDLSPKAPEVNLDKSLFIWRIKFANGQNHEYESNLSLGFFNKYLLTMRSPKMVSVYKGASWTFLRKKRTERFVVNSVDPAYFKIHQFDFLEGKALSEDQFRDQKKVIIISRRVRDEFFETDEAVGKTIERKGKRYRVVGVVENVPISCQNAYADFWIPRPLLPNSHSNPYGGNYTGIFLTTGKENMEEVRDEVKSIVAKINANFTKGEHIALKGPELHFDKFHIGHGDLMINIGKTEDTKYAGRWGVWMQILGKFFLILLVPIISVISLNVTYIYERSEEIAVRKAFGAKRFSIIKQMLSENIVQTLLGGLLGLGLSIVVAKSFPDFLFDATVGYFHGTYQPVIDINIFFIALGIILLLGVLSGLVPALKISNVQPATVLKGGGK